MQTLTGAVSSCAAGFRFSIEGKWRGGALWDALCKEALPPSEGWHPWRRADGGHEEEYGDGAAGKSDDLKTGLELV